MHSGEKAPKRLGELDSLRGLAAMAVVLYHLVLAFKPDRPPLPFSALFTSGPHDAWTVWRLVDTLTPLHLFFAGKEAVILFFVLSGFVLSIPLQNRGAAYAPFALKRVCRIYLPYLGSLALAIALNASVSHGGLPSMGAWFQRTWTLPIRWTDVRDHLVFVGSYDWLRFNTAYWSLVYEMRISLLFPLLMIVVRAGWRLSAIAIAALLSAYLVCGNDNSVLGACGATAHFASFFALGALLARHRHRLVERTMEAGRTRLWALAIVCAALLNYGLMSANRVGEYPAQCLTAVGSGLLIVLAMSIPGWKRFLNRPTLRWLGAISYSLYLMHGTVLFTAIYLLYPPAGWRWVAAIYVPLSLAAAYAFHLLVERPSIRLSHRLGGGTRTAEFPAELPARSPALEGSLR